MLSPASRSGVEQIRRGVDECIQDRSRNAAAALAPHGGDHRHIVRFADSDDAFLALHHIHESDRHRDDERRTQAGLNLVRDLQQRRGRVADSEDRAELPEE